METEKNAWLVRERKREDTDWGRTWQWIAKGDLKGCTEEGMMENENFNIILWDFTVQCDRKIKARKPNTVFIDKKRKEVVITDVAIPGDNRVKDRELEKIEKYQLLKDEIAKVWRMRKVIAVPVIGALGAIAGFHTKKAQVQVP